LGLIVFLIARGAAAGSAEPFDPATVPDALRPWIEWVLAEEIEHACPFLSGAGERRCIWSGPLALVVDADGARFTQSFEVASSGAWVTLPGDAALWPAQARVDGQPLAVIPEPDGEMPTAWLARGRHQIDGWLRFRAARQRHAGRLHHRDRPGHRQGRPAHAGHRRHGHDAAHRPVQGRTGARARSRRHDRAAADARC